jgi:hypothetical protein
VNEPIDPQPTPRSSSLGARLGFALLAVILLGELLLAGAALALRLRG